MKSVFSQILLYVYIGCVFVTKYIICEYICTDTYVSIIKKKNINLRNSGVGMGEFPGRDKESYEGREGKGKGGNNIFRF